MLIKTFLNHPLRIAGRTLWLCAQLLVAILDHVLVISWRGRESKPALRAAWMQRNGRRLLRVLNVTWATSGPVPHRGLLAGNHLSYVDILVLAAIGPCAFVAKREVKGWPVFGWLAQFGGTIFVHREKRTEVGRTTREIDEALNRGILLILYPEGTSSDGSGVLPFKSALLEPASQPGRALSVAHIWYRLEDGDVGQEVCYWGDMTLVPHLLNLLGKRHIQAHVSFAQISEPSSDRKELARRLHAEVVRLKQNR